MRQIDKSKPVLVTGGTGYVASWIIKKLLEDGMLVHASCRDPSNTKLVDHLKAFDNSLPGKLKLFKADLLNDGSFDLAMRDCELVIHTASPFYLIGIKNPQQELIQPAREGTKNVLESANRTASVKRVVLTSSIAALFGDNADKKLTSTAIFSEEDWNTTSNIEHQPYAYSKTVAEKAAWEIVSKQDRWDLVVINPGWVLGPSLSKRSDSMSISTMIQLGDGTFKAGVPELFTAIADVRNVAEAHISAGFTPTASGRHIVSSGEHSLLDIANVLRNNFGDKFPLPRKEVPKLMFWLVAPLFGYTRKYVTQNVGFEIKLDNSYSKKDLGISYIPFEQTVKEHFQQILDDGLLKNPNLDIAEIAH